MSISHHIESYPAQIDMEPLEYIHMHVTLIEMISHWLNDEIQISYWQHSKLHPNIVVILTITQSP